MWRGRYRNRIFTVTLLLALVAGGLGVVAGSRESVVQAFVYGFTGGLLPFWFRGLSSRLLQSGRASNNPARVVRWSSVYRFMMFPVASTGTEEWEALAHTELGTQASFIKRLDRKSATQPFARLLRAESDRDWHATKVAALAVLAGSFGREEKLSALTKLARIDPGAALHQRFSTPEFRSTESADITLLLHCGVETPVKIGARLGLPLRTAQAVVMFRRGHPAEAFALLDELETTQTLTAAESVDIERLRSRPPAPFTPTEDQAVLIRRLDDRLAEVIRADLADGPPMTTEGRAR